MIEFLPEGAWREFRGIPKQRGLNQTTHLALIEDSSGKTHKCYVKMSPMTWPTPLTEALAWLISGALEIPRPGFAAVLEVPIHKLSRHMVLDQHWLTKQTAIGFCAKAVEGDLLAEHWSWMSKLRKKGLYNAEATARVSAFDQWVENQDRHEGNVIPSKEGAFVPIDNELILYSVLWTGIASFNHNSLLEGAKRYLKQEELDKFIRNMALASSRHETALDRVRLDLKDTTSTLIPDPNVANSVWTQIESFLRDRAPSSWMNKHLGVLL